MSRWRRRVSEAGVEELLAQTIAAAVKTQTIGAKGAERVIVDTTVQGKAVRFPTDARLVSRCREHLVKLTQWLGIGLRQSYARVGAKALRLHGRYRHAKQGRRVARELRRLKTWLGRVVGDLRRRVEHQPLKRQALAAKLAQADQLLSQTRTSKDKLYSLHAPEVECIAKGKVHKRYEFVHLRRYRHKVATPADINPCRSRMDNRQRFVYFFLRAAFAHRDPQFVLLTLGVR